MAKVAVAMSGGVDSAVAAALMIKQGHEVMGITMRLWAGGAGGAPPARHACYGPGEREDIEDARTVAEKLGIPFHVFGLEAEYRAVVLDYVCREYSAGRTPNPCVRCNTRIKFGTLIEKARTSGLEFDYIASGHYAQVDYDTDRGRYLLRKARDVRKDQSYFLFALSQAQLGKLCLPLAGLTKDEVRRLAQDFGLLVAEKEESQDFAEGGYMALFSGEVKPGPILDESGKVLGQHRGLPFYTIGQHKKLDLPLPEPLYVTSIRPESNVIVVGPRESTCYDTLVAGEVNWVAIAELTQPLRAQAKIRLSHKEAGAILTPLDGNRVEVRFHEAQLAVTPGQAVVFYEGDILLGGGIIERAGAGE
jgi:tRNA-specific 2-thiouridylase